LAEIAGYAELLDQRRELVIKLIECSEKQIALLSSDREDENLFSLFSSLVEEWNQYTEQLDRIQSLLASLPGAYTDGSKDLIEFFEKLALNVERSKGLLEQSVTHTGIDLRNAKAQRRLMDAYYGMNNPDQIPLYFDKKK